VLAQLPVAANAWVLVGAVVGQLPFGRCLTLETSNTFTTLVGGDVAAFAVLPSPHLGLRDTRLDAAPRIRMTTRRPEGAGAITRPVGWVERLGL